MVETLHWLCPLEEEGEGVPPTYEAKGKTPWSNYCSVCYLVIEEIPALKDLRVLVLPANLTEIDDDAFQGVDCQAVIIPESCTRIGAHAFRNCKSLIFVSIPSGTEVDDTAFEGSDRAWIYRR